MVVTGQNPAGTVARIVGLTRLAPPRHRRKDALLNGDAGGSLLLHEHKFESLVFVRASRCVVLGGQSINIPVVTCLSTLDFIDQVYGVHVLADGVSSCDKEEVPLALEWMRQASAQITTNGSAVAWCVLYVSS